MGRLFGSRRGWLLLLLLPPWMVIKCGHWSGLDLRWTHRASAPTGTHYMGLVTENYCPSAGQTWVLEVDWGRERVCHAGLWINGRGN